MKKVSIVLIGLSLLLTSFKTNTMVIEKKKRVTSSEQMAGRIVSALQHSSAEEYVAMFPSLEDFNDLMRESSEIYGTYLADAQREFARSYEYTLLPTVEHSFDVLLIDGRSKGIDWDNIRFVSVELGEQPQHRFSPVPLIITISSSGVEHRIQVERALVIKGQWKVSQFIKLV